MAGDLAAEDRVGLAHAALEERVADAVHVRLAVVAGHRVLDRVAGAHVVDDRLARLLDQERLGEQRGDEVAGDELAVAVDEEHAVGVAVPGDADVGLLGQHPLGDGLAVLLDERVGFVDREGAVRLEGEPRRLARQLVEQLRRDQAAHAAGGVEHDVERLDERRDR